MVSTSTISVPFGTDVSGLGLPTTVSVTMSDNSVQTMTVAWDGGAPAYDGSTPGSYAFIGTLTLPENVTNTSNVSANVSVTVEPESVVEKVKDGTSSVINGAANLISGIWFLLKWLASLLGFASASASRFWSGL
jgi:hypothetical protein